MLLNSMSASWVRLVAQKVHTADAAMRPDELSI
jgi:hypothetical protein